MATTLERPQVVPAAAAASGIPDFETIFRDEAAYMGRALRYLGVGEANLEDACQEVFLVVHRRLRDYGGGSLRAWIRQICVFVARNHRRSLARHPEDLVGELPEAADPPDQAGALERRRLRDRLLTVLDGLPEEQRAAFVLFEIECLSMAETAQALSCPLQTAYSRLHAARERIHAAISEEDPS
jgi:RNA polymerase sigma-70 factor (ECF subfamily)